MIWLCLTGNGLTSTEFPINETLCEHGSRSSLMCPHSKPYINVLSVKALTGCQVRGRPVSSIDCALIGDEDRGSGEISSDECNWYKLRVQELCQGFTQHCPITYQLVIADAPSQSPTHKQSQLTAIRDNLGCATQSAKALSISYICTDSGSSLRDVYYTSLQKCLDLTAIRSPQAAADAAVTATEVELIADVMTRVGKSLHSIIT